MRFLYKCAIVGLVATLLGVGGFALAGPSELPSMVVAPGGALVSTGALAVAAEEPSALGDAFNLIPQLVKAVAAGNYVLAVSLALVLAVYVTRKWLWKSIPTKWIPLAMPLTAAALGAAGSLQAGADPWTAALNALTAGFAAVGLNQAHGRARDLIVGPPDMVVRPSDRGVGGA